MDNAICHELVTKYRKMTSENLPAKLSVFVGTGTASNGARIVLDERIQAMFDDMTRGSLDSEILAQSLERVGIVGDHSKEIQALFERFNVDKSGTIQRDEFIVS